jgi:putative tryptophan/tyrosine transport system substrate-binding protein
MMKRRDFITLLGGAAAVWPLAARAQQTRAVRRLGILIDAGEADSGTGVVALRQGLERSGWSEGQNLQTTVRWGEGSADRARAFATELVKMSPDVILASGGTGLTALLSETRTIPIVFVWPGDPIAAGVVVSMAHPGGNATGFTAFEGGGIATKLLELLKRLAPATRRVLVLNSGNPNSLVYLPAIENVIGSLGMEMASATVSNAVEIERAIETAAREPKTGMMVLAGSLMTVHHDLIVALAARHQLPAVYPARIFVLAGGLMSYGTDQIELIRQASLYVDRILRGEKPSDLPVQAATKFELVINLKAAKAVGLTVPSALLASADEVIE